MNEDKRYYTIYDDIGMAHSFHQKCKTVKLQDGALFCLNEEEECVGIFPLSKISCVLLEEGDEL